MKGSASLLLPLHSLPFTTAAAASKKEQQPCCWQLFSTPFAAGASPCSGTRRITVALRANAGKGFGQIAEEKLPPPPRTTTISGGGSGGNSNKEDDDEIPQVVFERMIRRILFYVGAPMATGVGLLYLLDRVKSNHILDVPLWVPFMVILIGFGTSALGIAYGTLSTSWDPEKEGSLLGWEEAQKNWPMLWEEDEGTTNVK
ncbi:uncharacterized protein PAM68-like [Nymphaea colorata]|uniref:Uncharacterized protein n=1 Tax=Nymphaea colorata TaxID=210225 RepID=A0A5K1CQU3_9MAGN|nr:uncharacterized protein PAM68-like [Nymphaea colorata]